MRKVVVLGKMFGQYVVWIRAVSFCMEILEKVCFVRQERAGKKRTETLGFILEIWI